MWSGLFYIICKEGLIKLLVIGLSSSTFGLLIDTGYYKLNTRFEWIFAAFLVSCMMSVIIYVFRVLRLSNKLENCGPCSFNGFDFLWSWICSIWCMAAAVAFATDFPTRTIFGIKLFSYWKMIGSVGPAFLTSVIYAIESSMLSKYAPGHLGYVATKRGWSKLFLVALGGGTVALFISSGYPWSCTEACQIGNTCTLAVFVGSWSITSIMWIMHLLGVISKDPQSCFRRFEISWSLVSSLLFLGGAICFGMFLRQECEDLLEDDNCKQRLACLVLACANVVLYVVDAALNKPDPQVQDLRGTH